MEIEELSRIEKQLNSDDFTLKNNSEILILIINQINTASKFLSLIDQEKLYFDFSSFNDFEEIKSEISTLKYNILPL